MISGAQTIGVWDALILALKYLLYAMPVLLPAVFITIWFNRRLYYVRSKNWAKAGYVLLELKLPREITKSPEAMEMVLGAFHQPSGESTWIDRAWEGKTRVWSSLELISTGGKIRFFIWIRPSIRKSVEAQIYSQYPEVEIYEAEDYTKPFYYDPQKFDIDGGEMGLTQKDAYPIKTYIDYRLEQNPKEEHKIDPITPLLELLGSITAGENIWIQIIIRAHKKRRLVDVFKEKEDAWKDEAKKEVEEIIKKLKADSGPDRRPTLQEKMTMDALSRSVMKFSFDCTIRFVYIAEKEKFNSSMTGGIKGIFKQFSSPELNGFKPKGWSAIYDYPWQEWPIFYGPKERLKPLLLEEYKLRRYFYSPYRGRKWYNKPFILNAEELATVYHLPGEVAATPTLERIPSVKSTAPPNLPT